MFLLTLSSVWGEWSPADSHFGLLMFSFRVCIIFGEHSDEGNSKA